jgi:iron complex outermembrane receptor protein
MRRSIPAFSGTQRAERHPEFLRLAFIGAATFLSMAIPAWPQQAVNTLTDLSLQDLMNIQVTSVSGTDQKLSQAAAAVFVITQEDIHRSGATNIPDLLRMVPGVDVAQINANTWAVSARGFNHQFTDKLLVLVDGRAVYSPLLGGVNWDTQDVPLEDIDRIEVIRGPGATIWGANAVNGVINITTRKTVDTQGGMIVAGGGSNGQADGTLQYGGAIGNNTTYRVFTKYLNANSLPPVPALDQAPGADAWHLFHGGFRVDTTVSPKDSVTLQGDLYAGNEGATIVHIFSIDPPVTGNLNTITNLSGGNILGRWEHTFAARSDTTLQVYFDHYDRTGPEASETRSTVDFDFKHHWLWGARQDVLWGFDYRHTSDHTGGTVDQAFTPADGAASLLSFFFQDSITLKPDRLFLTVGSKLEDNYYSGFEIEPSVRLAWTPSRQLTFWSSVSRAQRSPDRRHVAINAGLVAIPDPKGSATPVEIILFCNPLFHPEIVLAYEAGFRAQFRKRLSLDVSTFFNDYDRLESLEPGPEVFEPTPAPARYVMPVTFANLMHGTTEGAELSLNLELTRRWTLSPGYSFLEMHLHTEPTSLDTTSAANYQGSSPQHEAKLRSHVELFHNVAWDASAFFVSALPFQQVNSYTRVDSQLAWKFAEQAELSIVGQNLLQSRHLESDDIFTLVNPALIRRSAYAKITWRF